MRNIATIAVASVLVFLAGVALAYAEPPAAQPAAAELGKRPAPSPVSPLVTLRYRRGASAIAISPDGRLLASSWYIEVRLTDIETGKLARIGEVSSSTPNSLAFSPDGKFLMAGTSSGKVEVLDTRTLVVEKVLPVTQWGIYALAASPDSTRLACCAADGTVQLWDLKAGEKLRTFGVKGPRMESLAFTPNGKMLAALDREGRCNVWNAETGELAASVEPLNKYDELGVGFSGDGATLAVAGRRSAVQLWDFAKKEAPRRIRVPDELIGKPRINGFGFSPDEGRPMNAPLATVACGPTRISDDQRTAATVLENGSIAVWDIGSRQVRKTLPAGHENDAMGGGIRTLCFNRDGRLLADMAAPGYVDVWRTDGGGPAAARPPIEADEWPGPWGTALNGLRTRLILKPVKPGPNALYGASIDANQIAVSEGVWWRLSLQLRNETDKKLTFQWPDLSLPGALVITSEDGKPVAYRAIAKDDHPVVLMTAEPASGISTEHTTLVGRNYDVTRPGKYRIQFQQTEAAPALRDRLTNPVLPASNVLEFDNGAR